MSELTASQARALAELLPFAHDRTPFTTAVLSGSAGSGKTHLVGTLVNQLVSEGLSVAVTAPTNKAVRVLRERLTEVMTVGRVPDRTQQAGRGELRFGSIHSLLGLKLTENEDGSQHCAPTAPPQLDDYDVVVVDEGSMIGQELFRPIVRARSHAKVLFVGDAAQLPPIEDTEALSPTFTEADLKLGLTEIVRQAKDNPIITLASAVREHIAEETRVRLDRLPELGMTRIGDSRQVVQEVLEHPGQDVRIVAYTNAKVVYYNQLLHVHFHGDATPFAIGERVLVHQQCESRDGAVLITNEEGFVEAIVFSEHERFPDIAAWQVSLRTDDGAEHTVYVPDTPEVVEARIAERFSAWRRLKAQGDRAGAKDASAEAWSLRKAFAPLRHTFAMTAHKSQGSTFDVAVLDYDNLQRLRSTFAFNRGLYVAMTRPRHTLRIIHG